MTGEIFHNLGAWIFASEVSGEMFHDLGSGFLPRASSSDFH